jgi:hypothetical protein
MKKGWDYIKSLMASAHCGTDPKCLKYDMEERRMVITFIGDNYGYYSTIFISLEGSPPKAYAVLKVCCGHEFKTVNDGNGVKLYGKHGEQSGDRVCINKVKIMDSDLNNYKTLRVIKADKPVIKLSLNELLSRKDVVLKGSEEKITS